MYRPLRVSLVIDRENYSFIYRAIMIISIMLLCILTFLLVFKYDTYIITYGKSNNDTLEIIVDSSFVGDIISNHSLFIDGQEYSYRVSNISEEIYADNNYQMYQYVYLDIFKFNSINNYVYQVKIKKARKNLISYLIQDMF